jgi:hypothetical protein
VFSRVYLVTPRDVKLTVVIDQSEANAVEPADASQQILVDPLVPEKIHDRFEFQAESLDDDQVTKGVDATGSCAESLASPASTSRFSISACLRSNRQWLAPVSTYARKSTIRFALASATGTGIPSADGVYK